MISYEQSMIEGPAGGDTPPDPAQQEEPCGHDEGYSPPRPRSREDTARRRDEEGEDVPRVRRVRALLVGRTGPGRMWGVPGNG